MRFGRTLCVASLLLGGPAFAGPADSTKATKTTKTAPTKDGDVDPKLVQMFNDVVAHAKDGDPAAALAGYREILKVQRAKRLKVIPRFLATVHLQASYSLIDLGKLKDAEAELKLVDPNAFAAPQRYDYYFTLGN